MKLIAGVLLYFRAPRPLLSNNVNKHSHALLHHTLDKRHIMREQFSAFMKQMFKNTHAELPPTLKMDEECWYLPLFGVYHPQKVDQIHVVFDSSEKHGDASLNEALFTGPDLNNSLLGVLVHFSKEPIAITADIQQMFYCFVVRKDLQNYLKFFQYRLNDVKRHITEYWMQMHIFGNSPSPVVSI